MPFLDLADFIYFVVDPIMPEAQILITGPSEGPSAFFFFLLSTSPNSWKASVLLGDIMSRWFCFCPCSKAWSQSLPWQHRFLSVTSSTRKQHLGVKTHTVCRQDDTGACLGPFRVRVKKSHCQYFSGHEFMLVFFSVNWSPALFLKTF